MKTKLRIAFVADLTADIYVDSHTVKYGGAALNMAMWAKRVGVNPEIVSAVGNDADGKGFLSYIRKQGLVTIGIQKKRGPTSSIEIFLKNGERNYGQWRPGVLATFHLRRREKTFLQKVDAIVVTIYPQYEHILGELKRKLPFVVINFGDLKEFHDDFGVVERYADKADILLFGLDKDADEPLINRIRDLSTSTRMCMVTLGKYGSVAWLGGKTFVQPAKEVAVVDTTGAGDAFQVGFLAHYLSTRNIQESLRKGTILASRAIRKVGAY